VDALLQTAESYKTETVDVAQLLKTASQFKADGNEFFKKQEYRKALAKYGKIPLYVNGLSFKPVSNDPAKIDEANLVKELRIVGNVNSAMCCLKLNEFDRALDFSQRALNVDPTHKKAIFRHGQSLLRLGDLDGAEKDLTASAINFPHDAEVAREIAVLNQKKLQQEQKQKQTFSGMFDRMKGSLVTAEEEQEEKKKKEQKMKEDERRAKQAEEESANRPPRKIELIDEPDSDDDDIVQQGDKKKKKEPFKRTILL